MASSSGQSVAIAVLLGCASHVGYVGASSAKEPTPGYPEAVIQWGVQRGETCDHIAEVLYGSSRHVGLIQRYNRVACGPGTALAEGLTLVLPAEVTSIPDAKIRSMHPDVRARAAAGAWAPAAPGMPLVANSSVNTLDEGRADIEFVDRTRVLLAPNTLVVIYGTASRTRVSKTPPAAVELADGEVKAALAALRGQSVDVATGGGGRVSASSRDTVVQRRGERTTVAVFDGKAGVSSGGVSVVVPKDHGTRFSDRAPPARPRPLPPPPEWTTADVAPIALAPAGLGVLSASWKPAPGAAGYRVEVARDPELNDLVVREEVKPDVVSFRAEKMPAGAYFLRVRVIDREEYLGVGAVRRFHLVAARVSGGVAPAAREITANPYGIVELTPSPALELSLDDGPFGPIPERIDLLQRAPRALRLRERGSAAAERAPDAVTSLPVRYTAVSAAIQAARVATAGGQALEARVALDGVAGVDVAQRVAPRIVAHLPGGVRSAALTGGAQGGALTARIPLPPEAARPGEPLRVRLDVADGRGGVLGTSDVELPAAPGPARAAVPPPPAAPVLGAYLPLLPVTAAADALWLGPTPPAVVAVGAAAVRAGGGWVAAGQVRASGAIGPLGLDAALRSNPAGDGEGGGSTGWLGARFRAVRLERSALELGPTLRLGVPLADGGPPVRVEPGVALGGAAGRLTWVVDAGLRIRAGRGGEGAADGEGGTAGGEGGAAGASGGGAPAAPPSQGFLLAGAAADAAPWLRLHGALDLHLVHRDDGANDVLGGLSAGAEAGGALFGALSVRVSPWREAGEGPVTAQIAVGFREAPP
ncbi:FecR domain-containing protein [Sorangium sp. Soce836]|uniref:FecR domain-containing protein n=1 Tax=Sorangium sp. So ce836 TaxID=2969250 RepID=UPI00234FEDE2|nr:FecR domain-containing protein [Sorangium sp. Soce836]